MNKEYWEQRVLDHQDDMEKMVWSSATKFHPQFAWFKIMVEKYFGMSTLELGCGYGRASHLFTGEYLGLDFSENMIALAKREHPDRNFIVGDAYTYVPEKEYDVILAFHLSGLPEREGEFALRYKPFAKEMIIIVYGDSVKFINPKL